MLTPAERATFEETGLLRIAGAFSSAEAAAMQRVVWDEVERVHDMRRDEPSTWRPHEAFGLQRITGAPVFAPIGGAPLRAAIDDLLGAGAWRVPKRWGAVLVTFPAAGGRWMVPPLLWHADFPFSVPARPLAGVKVFSFVSDVPPRGGGTLVVRGSHRAVERFVAARAVKDTRQTRLAFLASHAWWRELASRTRRDDGVARFLDAEESVDGVRLQVMELTGRAGDIVLTHPWVFHCRALNCATAPRFMRNVDVYRESVALDLGMVPTPRRD